MSPSFTILHLSDAHIGNPRYATDLNEVMKPLLEDLAKVGHDHALSPDLIVFSGDLAFGEIAKSPLVGQYSSAGDWLRLVCSSLSKDWRDIPMLIVPGNHDVNRLSIGEDQQKWLDELSGESGADEIDHHMKTESVVWRRLLERQREWASFATPLMRAFSIDGSLLTTGIFGCDDKRIGVAGLNTSWASSQEKEQGRLWIGKHQAQKAWQAVQSCDFRIVVTHHPLSWLNAAEQTWMEQKLETHFHLHLHGHTHDQWMVDIRNHLRVAAGPCYQGSSKENAYSWITIDFDTGVRAFLREYKRKGMGGWGPMHIPGKTTELGIFEKSDIPSSAGRNLVAGAKRDESAIPQISSISMLDSLIRVLDEYFGLRWEPSTFRESESAVLYWPVRLRPATPIHAMQSFIAASLQKKGVAIKLFLDDLGNTESTREMFASSASRWFNAVGARFEDVAVSLFSEVATADTAGGTWEITRKWLSENSYRLEKVLEVSKLTIAGQEIRLEELLQRRPRRLLTPPLVWTCLSYLLEQNSHASVITLGGYDERVLWKAWRESVRGEEVIVGHLYGPVLEEAVPTSPGQPVHMATTNLAWDSREDILNALEEDRLAGTDAKNYLALGRMAEWCIRGAILLPRFVADQPPDWEIDGKKIGPLSNIMDLNSIEPLRLSKEISVAVAEWVL